MNKISVILPTNNGEDHISEAIESVFSQSFSDFELIVINDGSTDNTEKIVLEYLKKDSRVKYLKNEKNLSLQKTLARGFKEAQGKYIARIDDDDIWQGSQKLEKQADFLEKNPEYVLVGSGAIVIDSKGKELYRFLLPEKDEDIRQYILFRNPFLHSSIVFLREAAEKFGGYDENLKELEDLDLWLKLGQTGKFYNFPEYLIKFRAPAPQKNITKARKIRTKALISVIKKQGKNYPNYKKAIFKNYLKLFYTYIPKPKFLEDYLYQKRQTSVWRI